MARRNNLMCVRFGYMCCVFEMSGLKTNLIKTSRRRDDDETWKATKEKEDSNNKFADLLSCCWYIKKSDARFRSLICGIEMTKTITTIRRFFFPFGWCWFLPFTPLNQLAILVVVPFIILWNFKYIKAIHSRVNWRGHRGLPREKVDAASLDNERTRQREEEENQF